MSSEPEGAGIAVLANFGHRFGIATRKGQAVWQEPGRCRCCAMHRRGSLPVEPPILSLHYPWPHAMMPIPRKARSA